MGMGHHTTFESRGYVAVFAALLALTVATVAASRLDASAPAAVTIGLAIAAVKAALVALYFMHLRHERRMIHLALTFTAIFCAGLIVLTLLTEADHAPGTRFGPAFDSAAP
jgi:cytochrome c oxidase subunit 4